MRKIWNLLLLFNLSLVPAVYAADMSHAMHGRHDHAAMMGMAKPAAWTAYPILKTRTSGERRTQTVTVVPQNIAANGIAAWSNNLKDGNGRHQLELEMAGARLDKPSSGGFHWLAAREEQDGRVRVASSVYYFGERGAEDPTALFLRQKHELEIIPQPFPREHSRYRANEEWRFLLRFNGQPLPGQKLALETQNGSKAEFLSDAQGVAVVHLPDDFKAAEESKDAAAHDHGARRGADFVLAAEYSDGGKSYLTAFNSSYGTNAFDQRSLALGVGFMLLGMAGAVPLLRQHKQKDMEEGSNA